MTSQLNVDTIVDKAGSGGTNVKIANNSVTVSEGGSVTTTTVQGLCKAWTSDESAQNNSATSNVDSFNVASTTDNGNGDMTITYTNGFTNDGYASTGTNNNFSDGVIINKYNITGGTFDRILLYRNGGSGYVDMAFSYMAFGDLA